MIEAVAGALSSIQSAVGLAQAINGTITAVKLAEVKAELLSSLVDAKLAISDAREQIDSARERIRALEAEIVQLKQWDSDADSYELADTGQGALAYRRKALDGSSEDGHWLCPNCFSNRKQSYLIPERISVGRTEMLRCHPCGMEIITRGMRDNVIQARRGR